MMFGVGEAAVTIVAASMPMLRVLVVSAIDSRPSGRGTPSNAGSGVAPLSFGSRLRTRRSQKEDWLELNSLVREDEVPINGRKNMV
jgi:hypothetical protein